MDKQEHIKRKRQLGAKLVEAREKAGLTQMQVAATGVIVQSDLSKLENGEKRVEFLLLVELAKLYNQPLDFFVPE